MAKQSLIAQFTRVEQVWKEWLRVGLFTRDRHTPLARDAVCCCPTWGNGVEVDTASLPSAALSAPALSPSKTSLMLRMGSPLITFLTSSRSNVSYSTSARANFSTPQRHHQVSTVTNRTSEKNQPERGGKVLLTRWSSASFSFSKSVARFSPALSILYIKTENGISGPRTHLPI